MFSEVYNSSIKGLFAVTASNVSTYEFMARSAVGMPLGFRTQAEMFKMQKEIDNKKGFSGWFLRLMGKLTGKKSIAEAARLKNETLKTNAGDTFTAKHAPETAHKVPIQPNLPKFSNQKESSKLMPRQSNNMISGSAGSFIKQRLNTQG